MVKSKLSNFKQNKLIEYFVIGVTANTAARVLRINHKSAVYYFRRIRELIAVNLASSTEELFSGEVEVDESYFGSHRKGKRGRGAAAKTPVFGILMRGGKVFTQVVMNAKSETLLPIINSKVRPDSIVYSDTWNGYNNLDVSDFRHMRINHSEQFADKQNHINGIENFWRQAKSQMRKFNGIPKGNFELFLKECEWRFNNREIHSQFRQIKRWVKGHLK